MERLAKASFSYQLRNYVFLMKPGIVFGNALTATGGFLLAAKQGWNSALFFAMLLGMSCIIASACIWNNYIDRELDGKMKRTRNRPLVKGAIAVQNAMAVAVLLGLLGTFVLARFTTPITTLAALLGFGIYVFVYSFSKYRTEHATLIGSIAGATPPVIGYTAVTGSIDLGAFIFFIMIVMWQMPHFFAIGMYRLDDYKTGGVPILPVKEGPYITKLAMLFYVIGFTGVSSLLTFFHYTGYIYLAIVNLLGLVWAYLNIQGFTTSDDRLWAKKMFMFSLLVVSAVSLAIALP